MSEDDIRYWLVNEDWYVSRHMQEWVARTPRADSVEILARIAEDAAPEPRSAGLTLLKTLAVAGFSMTGDIAGRGPDRRKAGIRAALMLAKLEDPRALVPLSRVFSVDPRRQNKYQELIEGALVRLLPRLALLPEAAEHAPVIREMTERIWSHGGDETDLPEPLADLMLAALEFLPHHASDGVRDVLRSGTLPESTKPNRRRVIESARTRFGSGG